MSTLLDLQHFFGTDISTDNTGDLMTVGGDGRTQQRIFRRLLTNPGGYIAQPKYGAGLPGFIGKAVDVATITAVIRGQIALEASVAKSPAPQISVTQSADDVSQFNVQINYTDSSTNTAAVLAFTVSKNSGT